MKQTRFMQMKDQMLARYGQQDGEKLVQLMEQEYEKLSSDYADRPSSLQNHLHNNIFPVVTAFHALIAMGKSRQQAADEAGAVFLKLMDDIADSIRRALKVPGLHRLIPWIFKTMMPKLFTEDAGFRFTFHPTDRHRATFDMQECPYLQVCRELDCPEIAPVFCATDDTCYGNMHPNLIWNRTKTLARGGDCCDFDLYLQKK